MDKVKKNVKKPIKKLSTKLTINDIIKIKIYEKKKDYFLNLTDLKDNI
jgi:hypothetical protein